MNKETLIVILCVAGLAVCAVAFSPESAAYMLGGMAVLKLAEGIAK